MSATFVSGFEAALASLELELSLLQLESAFTSVFATFASDPPLSSFESASASISMTPSSLESMVAKAGVGSVGGSG